MPKFSIVIPTRNRAHLLQYALRCALNQTYGDYEVIVSDNDSADGTPETVRKLADNRVRYVRTHKTLPMPDSWEFALGHARGEWITVLTDDSAISSRLLEEVDKTLTAYDTRVVSWSHFARYYHATWPKAFDRNQLTYHPFHRRRALLESRPVLDKLFHLQGEHRAPVMLNSFCHKSVIAEVKNRAGRFFFPPCPDISSCAATMAVVKNYVYIDLPLGINGIGKESIGMSQATTRGQAAMEFEKEFTDGPMLKRVPIKIPVIVSLITESLLGVKAALPDLLKDMDIDWGLYYYYCRENVHFLKSQGADVSRDEKEVLKTLGQLPWNLKMAFYGWRLRKKMASLQIEYKLRNFLRKAINRYSLTTRVESYLRERPDYGATVRGEDGGFTNIFEAMAYLDRHVFSNSNGDRLTPNQETEPSSRIRAMQKEMKEAPKEVLPAQFWESLNACHELRLEQQGFDNFKRTITMMYFTWFPRPFDEHSRYVQKQLSFSSNIISFVRAILAGMHKLFKLSDSFYYNFFTFRLWKFALQQDHDHLLEKLSEPTLGNPLRLFDRGKLISQDLANSFLEYQSVASALEKNKIKTVLELGAGYGRTAFVYLSLMPGIKYYVADIPPALYVAERYLSTLFPRKPVFRFRPFRKYSDIQEEFEKAELVFLLPHQLNLLPDKIADLCINISSFHEMRQEQINYYFQSIDRLAKHLYFKQFKKTMIPREGLPFQEEDYPLRKHWRQVFWRDCKVQTNFFEALFAL